MFKIFSNRRLLYLSVVVIVSNLVIAGVSMFVIYKKAITTQEKTLKDIVERQKSLVTVLYNEGKSEKEIIGLIEKMKVLQYKIGETGEFSIAKPVTDSILYLLANYGQSNIKISKSGDKGIPMQLALKGNTGVVIGNDYRGERVLAAYTYVPVIKWGIVAKISTVEVYKPYYEAFIVTLVISILLVSVWLFLLLKIFTPIIQELVNSDEFLKETQKIAQLGTYDLDITSGIWKSSQVLDAIFGIEKDYEKSVAGWVIIIHPEWQQIMNDYLTHEVIGDKSLFDKEYKIIRYNDKAERWVHGLGKLMFNENGAPINMVGTIRDITEKKEIELVLKNKNAEIEAQNEEYKALNEELFSAKEFAEANELKLKIQKEEIELNNERLESLQRISQFKANGIQELLDYALEEAIKLTNSKIGYIYIYNEITRQFTLNTWSKDVMKESAVANPSAIYDLDKAGCWGEAVRQRKAIVINDYEAENPHKKGTSAGHFQLHNFLTIPVIFENKIVAVAGVANKPSDYISSDVRQLTLLMDNVWKISERITLLENLRIAKERAEESDRLKTAFLQNVSHEIRTPMNAIIGFSELLVDHYKNRDKLEYYSNIISQRCFDLLEIINEILDIAKIESGQLPVNKEDCDLNQLFNDLYQFFNENQKRTDKEHIKFIVSIDCIPNGYIIITDKIKLKQIFINLISNAFKFTHKGEIRVGCQLMNNDKIEFFVSDTGIGIPKDKQNDIFERFTQLNYGKNRFYGGTGLGLPIVKGLINLLGGELWLESELNKGTTFYFTIPCEVINNRTIETVITDTNIDFDFSKKTMLLVEDDIYNSEFLIEIMKETGCNIIHTNFGKEAIDIAAKNQIDMVLMDIGLPDMDGYDAVKLIKELKPDLNIIAQTAFAGDEDKTRAFNEGCADYICKPIRRDALLSLLDKYFRIGNF